MGIRQLISSSTGALLRREQTIRMRAYASFEDALNDSDSYEDPRVIQIVSEKSRLFRKQLQSSSTTKTITTRQLSQNLFVLTYAKASQPLDVLEVGGSCGASYFQLRHLIPGSIGAWAIVETPAMAAAGKTFTDDDGLSFHSDFTSAIAALNSRDLAMAQGVLQYALDPLKMLVDIFGLGFRSVYVSRTVVLTNANRPHERVFTQQRTRLEDHGPGPLPSGFLDETTTQPLVLVTRESLLSTIPANYQLEFLFTGFDEQTLLIDTARVPVSEIGSLLSENLTEGC